MNRIHLKVMSFLLAFAFLITNLSCTFVGCFADEGLSDSQLYGYGSENVLGHKKKSSPVTPKYNTAEVDKDKVTTEEVSATEEVSVDGVFKEPLVDDAIANSHKKSKQENESNKDVDVKIIGVEDDCYYNDNLDISIDITGLSSGDAVDAVVFKKTFDGNSLRHNMIVNTEDDKAYSKETISEEGEYNLDVQVSRGLEVLKHTNRKFILDRTPPEFMDDIFADMGSDQIDVAYLISKSFSDNSPVETSVIINDSTVEGGVIKEPGEYDVKLKGVDKAGNVSDVTKNVVIENAAVNKKPVKQNMYHQLIGVTLLVGSSLFYIERKRISN